MATRQTVEFNLENHFLIAMPNMPDPRFKQSVVYICEHNQEGAMGIIINRPMDNLSITKLLLQLELMNEEEITHAKQNHQIGLGLEKPVMYGGPIAEDQGFVLHSSIEGFQISKSVSKNIMLTSSKDVLSTLGKPDQPSDYLIVLGYASWEPGQLEQEITESGWLTIPASEDLLFQIPIYERWEAAAKKLGVDIRQMSTQIGHA